MTKKKEPRTFGYWVKRFWNNYVVRNIILAASLLIIVVFLLSILLNVGTRHNKYRDVPTFEGLTMPEAGTLARKDRLRLEINDSLYVPSADPGVILEQNPSPGAKVKSGRRIFVTINSFNPRIVDVPYVTGYSLRQAKSILEKSGLEIDQLLYVNDIATNNVLRQHVGSTLVTRSDNVRAEAGTGVTLTVGKANDAARVRVPKIAGLTYHEAKSRLWDMGLNVGKETLDDGIDIRNKRNSQVYKQQPAYGTLVELGTKVSISMTTDQEKLEKGIRNSDSDAAKVRIEPVVDTLPAKAAENIPESETERYIQQILSTDDPYDPRLDDNFFD